MAESTRAMPVVMHARHGQMCRWSGQRWLTAPPAQVVCRQYAVPLAVVDGRSLAELAHGVVETAREPGMADLLVCLKNIQEVCLGKGVEEGERKGVGVAQADNSGDGGNRQQQQWHSHHAAR